MTNGFIARLVVGCACVIGCADLASAQTLNFSLGGFAPRGEDARVKGDVLNTNRTFLTFDIKDFNGGTFGVESLAPFGDFVEIGAGIAFYRGTAPSVYTNFTDADRTEVEQDLRLRIIPLTATVRIVPFGRQTAVQPYFGAGIGLFNWRYSESGEFIDFATPAREIFRDQFVATGNAAGPVALAGVRFGSGRWQVGGEARYSKAEGDLDETFASNKIDLGGWTYQATFGMKF